jgi:hypothetical protein
MFPVLALGVFGVESPENPGAAYLDLDGDGL